MAGDSAHMLHEATALIAAPGLADADIGHRAQRFLAAFARFDYVVIFAYRGSQRPLDLFNTFTPAEHRIFVRLYQDGAFRLDPFYHQARTGLEGLFRMRDLAPDRFFSSEYYRTYYMTTGLAEELGFFVPLPGGVTVVLSLMRRGTSGGYSARDMAKLARAEPLVAAFIRLQWSKVIERFSRTGRIASRSATAGEEARPREIWTQHGLTSQEARVIDFVLQGYSSESIGLRLAISTGTVKVHRRNVYRKLGISSQTQLLSLYLRGLLGGSDKPQA